LPPRERVFSPPELQHVFHARLTPDGWIALVLQRSDDRAIHEPLSLVWSAGGTIERRELPFVLAEDGSGKTPLFFGVDATVRRFLVAVGLQPKIRIHVWDQRDEDAVIEGTFFPYGGHAIAKTQALVVMGRMDKRGFVDHANGHTAYRYKNGAWNAFELPKPAENAWADCFWDVTARPGTDEFVLLQICAAPRREMAYALFRLDVEGDGMTRIPFDNEVFNPVRAGRGRFSIEEDGTIDLGSKIGGMDDGEMTLARLRGGKEPWSIVHMRMPTRLASSDGVFGDHVLLTDGGPRLRESKDGGRTFAPIPRLADDAIGRFDTCNAEGCSFLVEPPRPTPTRAIFRRW
jgi:hypothetical protein